ncbi:tetratricopeptide repeat protein [Streptomyces sp. HUAS ZL42]|uniref:tetratricopeptide repeat protein n=1 Tax=Streptomyces sp. HUAS ZL42 TaxID=3231715 RepID=UPI00345E08F1
MPEKRPSRKQLNRLRRRTGFIGRQNELTGFRENFAQDPDSATSTFQYLFHIHGDGGVGKTSLVQQWVAVAREFGAATVYLDDGVHSAVEAMEAISAQLGHQGMALKGFDRMLTTYRQRRHEAETPLGTAMPADAGGAGQQPAASASSTVMAQAGLAGLGMVPGLGAVAGAMDPQQVAQGADRLRAVLSARFRNHDDVQLVMSPVRVLTPVFLEGLAEAAERWPWVVLFLDVYEQTGPVLDEWLSDLLVSPDKYPDLPTNVVVVLSGRGRLSARYWADSLDLVAQVPLEVFTEDEARRLLAARGVTNEDVIEVVLQLSGRLPLMVDLLAQTSPQDPRDVGDLSGTAVDRFLQWITDPHRHAAALACALPLQLDEDVYRATVPDAAADEYAWLRGLPFVSTQAGFCRYHDVVRSSMLRLQRTQSPSRWQQQHTGLADIHRRRREALEATLPTDAYELWDDSTWREHRLNETYHRLCADPHQLRAALADAIHACDQGPAALRRMAQTLSQAGHDSGTEALLDWARRLTPPTDLDDDTALVAALTRLSTAPELTVADRALALTVRGREHRNAERYAQALDDYAAALALDADLARAHYGRGETYRLMGRHEEALPHLARAMELAPEDAEYVGTRGQAHLGLRRYAEALADLTRAIELDDTLVWAFGARGITHRLMERNKDALADFTRAVELDDTFAWTFGNRGVTHRLMGHHEEALRDLTRALELDGTLDWAIAERGAVHRLLERYEEALADLNRAVELDHNYTWALAERGKTHQAMEHYDDALADLNRAVELNSTYTWAFAERAITHRRAGNLADALTDFTRAIELDGTYAWAVANRGVTHRLMGHQEEALTDLTRAIELDDTLDWAFANRGVTHRVMRRLDEALADLDRAVELDDSYAWAIGNRGIAHQLMGHHEEALTDLTRAFALDNSLDWAIGARGVTYRLLDRYEEALADLDHALALDAGLDWALAERGKTHQSMEHYEESLADFTRAVELDDTFAWAIGNRGITHRLMGHHEEALTDLTRAIELDDTLHWALAERGVGHRLLERHEDALADLNRAIELNDTYEWALAERGRTHQATGDYEDALADLTRALELDDTYAWAVAQRGITHRLMGHHQDALTDLTRALELDDTLDWVLAERGLAHRLLGHHEDALADLTRALELDDTYAWAVAQRGITHRLMGHRQDALTDLTRALELDDTLDWVLAERGLAHRLLGHHEDALTDFVRALEDDPDDAWYHVEIAITLRLLGRPEEHGHWRTAVEMFTADSSAGGAAAAHARGNLLVIHCALARWTEAEEELDRFLACGPEQQRIREALDDLRDFQEALAMDRSRLAPLRDRLISACAPSRPAA